MSFRTLLTSFFVLIVIGPMIAISATGFRLIDQSNSGKADSRAAGLEVVAANLWVHNAATARQEAQSIVSQVDLSGARNPRERPQLESRLRRIARSLGIVRFRLTVGQSTVMDFGDRTAVAPGAATAVGPSGTRLMLSVSEITAPEFVANLAGTSVAVVVRNGSRTLGSSLPAASGQSLPSVGGVTIAGAGYRAASHTFDGFGDAKIRVSVLSATAATATSVTNSRILLAVLIGFVLVFAVGFALVASRQLQAQVGRFLQAARRLAGQDFSSPVETVGNDEFAQLGLEFNNMAGQLQVKIEDLDRERGRLREAFSMIGQTFESNLDRDALLAGALDAAIEGVDAHAGRLSVREKEGEPLAVTGTRGHIVELGEGILAAERQALASGGLGEANTNGHHIAAAALGLLENSYRRAGVMTVCRVGTPFSDADRNLLESLATQVTVALMNVLLHDQVKLQAVTDELTGLANHRRFQELLDAEFDQVRRYNTQVGLIMLDVDDFKRVNDTHGHPQGDVVLRYVARVVRDSSRDADTPARYGGEEMALILPHTDIDGAYAIAERIRTEIEGLKIPRLDGQGTVPVTASLGVASTTSGTKDQLVVCADGALYDAKRQGKNRTLRAPTVSANVGSAE